MNPLAPPLVSPLESSPLVSGGRRLPLRFYPFRRLLRECGRFVILDAHGTGIRFSWDPADSGGRLSPVPSHQVAGGPPAPGGDRPRLFFSPSRGGPPLPTSLAPPCAGSFRAP